MPATCARSIRRTAATRVNPGGTSIGSGGGTVSSPDGKVSITVAPGWLSSPTTISITRGVSELKVATTRTVITADLGPSGQTFNPPALVSFGSTDTNNNGLIDNTTIQEANLKIWRNGVLFAGPCSSAAYQQPACAMACNGLECCCDMNANTWTLQLDHFSQYIVGDTTSNLIPGGGSKASDCFVEYDAIAPNARASSVRITMTTFVNERYAARASHSRARRPCSQIAYTASST